MGVWSAKSPGECVCAAEECPCVNLSIPGPIFLVVAAVIVRIQEEPELGIEALIGRRCRADGKDPVVELFEDVGPHGKLVFRRDRESTQDRGKLGVHDLYRMGVKNEPV